MHQVRLTENFSLSQVIFGCMRIVESGISHDDLLKLVKKCLDLGIDTFDHAPVYGGYTCEKVFGDAVLRRDPALRSQMKLVTKTGIVIPGRKGNDRIYYDARKASILAEMDESLERLGTDHVDLLLVHRPDPLADPAETADALDTLIAQGKTLHVGVSNYTPEQTDALQKHLKAPLVTNQLEFSVKTVDNFFNGVSDDLFARGMKPMAWSPLGGGSVFKGEDEKSVRIRAAVKKLADKYGAEIDTIMYAWLFRHPLEIMAITGTMNEKRIENAVKALDIEIEHNEWYEIAAASRGFDVP